MIHLVLGTKAQYIKTAPVLWELEARKIPFRLVDTGQHAAHSSWLRQEFGIRPQDVSLRSGADLARLRTGLSWLAGWILKGLTRPGLVREQLFADLDGICLVHGDTASTWLGAWLAKRSGLKVAHLEAGLRSFHLLSPFPEELFRRRTSHMADLLLAPSAWAVGNLKKMRLRGSIVPLGANTGMETVRFSLRQPSVAAAPWPTFALATIHRMETLYSRGRLAFVAKALVRTAQLCPVLFLIHEPTRQALTRSGLIRELAAHPRIRCQPLVSHRAFLHLLKAARFVLTDGGSVQEESFYLNVPCLVLRDRTERPEGLIPPGNVTLARWRWDLMEEFLKRPENYHHREPTPQVNPSQRVVDALLRFGFGDAPFRWVWGRSISGHTMTQPECPQMERPRLLSVVIPVYNEVSTIGEVIARVQAAPLAKEIIVVDDGSTDGTRELLKGLERDPPAGLRFLYHDRNQGKGASIRTAVAHAQGEMTIIQDADLEYDPAEYGKLIEPILSGDADVVYGSRFLGGPHRVLYFRHQLGNSFLTLLSNLCTDLNLSDMETGYKVFKTEVLKRVPLRSNRFGFEPEITAKVARMRCRVYEVPISYRGRDYSQGKKITWKDGLWAVGTILRYWLVDDLGPRDFG